ncbi:hypothetical protein B0H16DRAFT_1847831 [Mycena metata]|uniref:Uncharacterized protein n=1 Tax=Mycena metata TaxID=1033252 RepID=A0AAD7IR96_9AGAR|nr:hypothetical protein B0H16DRAFT_1847831 [Mycena metata]
MEGEGEGANEGNKLSSEGNLLKPGIGDRMKGQNVVIRAGEMENGRNATKRCLQSCSESDRLLELLARIRQLFCPIAQLFPVTRSSLQDNASIRQENPQISKLGKSTSVDLAQQLSGTQKSQATNIAQGITGERSTSGKYSTLGPVLKAPRLHEDDGEVLPCRARGGRGHKVCSLMEKVRVVLLVRTSPAEIQNMGLYAKGTQRSIGRNLTGKAAAHTKQGQVHARGSEEHVVADRAQWLSVTYGTGGRRRSRGPDPYASARLGNSVVEPGRTRARAYRGGGVCNARQRSRMRRRRGVPHRAEVGTYPLENEGKPAQEARPDSGEQQATAACRMGVARLGRQWASLRMTFHAVQKPQAAAESTEGRVRGVYNEVGGRSLDCNQTKRTETCSGAAISMSACPRLGEVEAHILLEARGLLSARTEIQATKPNLYAHFEGRGNWSPCCCKGEAVGLGPTNEDGDAQGVSLYVPIPACVRGRRGLARAYMECGGVKRRPVSSLAIATLSTS